MQVYPTEGRVGTHGMRWLKSGRDLAITVSSKFIESNSLSRARQRALDNYAYFNPNREISSLRVLEIALAA